MLPPLTDPGIQPSAFPTRWQEVLFRNFGRVPNQRLAALLEMSPAELEREAVSLGLRGVRYDSRWLREGYITLIYQNWKLLPYAQLLQLLDWSEDRLAFVLKEEDFLLHKLGFSKPDVPPVRYSGPAGFPQRGLVEALHPEREPDFDFGYFPLHTDGLNPFTDESGLGLTAAARLVSRVYGSAHRPDLKLVCDPTLGEEAFRLRGSTLSVGAVTGALRGMQAYWGDRAGDTEGAPAVRDRLVFDYQIGCGDLGDVDVSRVFSDELLSMLFRCRINGIWMHAIFYQLADFPFDPRYSQGRERRIQKLNEIVAKCAPYGIRIWLYVNEPRCMPIELFDRHPQLLGCQTDQNGTLCTSVPAVTDWLQAAACQIAREVPELGGMLSITMSENLTNCYSKGQQDCPRCTARPRAEVISEVNNRIAAGLKQAGTGARLVAWTWGCIPALGWDAEQLWDAISRTDPDTAVMSTSEDDLPLPGGDTVTDYSIAHPGPSPKTLDTFRVARRTGHPIWAKVQISDSWECPAVPYIPVFSLQTGHIRRLLEQKPQGLMLSWTLGGWPGGSMELVGRMCYQGCSPETALCMKYGSRAQEMQEAGEALSRVYEKLPYCTMFYYTGPISRGPALPMFLQHRPQRSSMIGYVYDDPETWCIGTDETRFTRCLGEVAESWGDAEALFPPDTEERNMAAAAGCIFRSAYHYLRFTRSKTASWMQAEQKNVQKLLGLMQKDGRLGYEASNHYLFTCRELIEKLVQLDWELPKTKD